MIGGAEECGGGADGIEGFRAAGAGAVDGAGDHAFGVEWLLAEGDEGLNGFGDGRGRGGRVLMRD